MQASVWLHWYLVPQLEHDDQDFRHTIWTTGVERSQAWEVDQQLDDGIEIRPAPESQHYRTGHLHGGPHQPGTEF